MILQSDDQKYLHGFGGFPCKQGYADRTTEQCYTNLREVQLKQATIWRMQSIRAVLN